MGFTVQPDGDDRGRRWVIAAGNKKNGYNAMTASWGHLGSIWERPGGKAHRGLPSVVCYLRPLLFSEGGFEWRRTCGGRKVLYCYGIQPNPKLVLITGEECDKI